jgi:hypothetical protein
MRSWLTLPLAWIGLIAAAADPPVRLGVPAPDWAVETADGKPASLFSHLRQHKRDAVLLVPRAGEAIPRQDIERARKELAERDADVLVAPSRSDAGRPGLDSAAPATLLIDSGGIVRRIEPGRLLNGKDLEDFLDQWRLGRGVFLSACARCHGDDGSLEVCGDVKPLTGIGNRLTPAQVYERLRVGELSQHEVLVRGRFHKRAEIEAVVVFVRGL